MAEKFLPPYGGSYMDGRGGTRHDSLDMGTFLSSRKGDISKEF